MFAEEYPFRGRGKKGIQEGLRPFDTPGRDADNQLYIEYAPWTACWQSPTWELGRRVGGYYPPLPITYPDLMDELLKARHYSYIEDTRCFSDWLATRNL